MYLFITKLLISFLCFVFPKSRLFKVQKPGKGVYLYRWKLWKSHHGDRYLHCIARSDDDPDPHNHPWDFTTFVIAGGYFDAQYTFDDRHLVREYVGIEDVLPWTTSKRRASHIHMVHLKVDDEGRPRPAWTLVKTGPYGQHRDWEFVTQNRKVPWREYLGVPEEGDR